jgi:hypothetical protein
MTKSQHEALQKSFDTFIQERSAQKKQLLLALIQATNDHRLRWRACGTEFTSHDLENGTVHFAIGRLAAYVDVRYAGPGGNTIFQVGRSDELLSAIHKSVPAYEVHLIERLMREVEEFLPVDDEKPQ